MDFRYHQLETVLAYEGLSAAERDFGTDFLEVAPANQVANLTLLLRGVLSERGQLLDNTKAAAMMGKSAAWVLLAGLLNDNRQADHRPAGTLSDAECDHIMGRQHRPGLTCARLLEMFVGTKAEIRARQVAAARTRHSAAEAQARTVRHQPAGPPNQDAEHDAYQPQGAETAEYYAKN